MRSHLALFTHVHLAIAMLLAPSSGFHRESHASLTPSTHADTRTTLIASEQGMPKKVATTGNPSSTLYLPLVMLNYDSLLPPIVPGTTNVLSETTLSHLASVSGDGALFVFSQSTPELASLAPGEIMVGGVSPNTPYGFLRKVAAITPDGQQLLAETDAATLEEAVQQGEVSLSQLLKPEDVQTATVGLGVSLTARSPSANPHAFYIEVKDVVVYDDDGNPSTTSDQIVANGKVEVEPTLNLGLKIRDSGLESLNVTTEVQETVELEFETRLEKPILEGEKEIARFSLTPITVMIGVVPLVFVPVLTVNIGVEGKVHIGVVTRVTQVVSLKAGASYTNSAWTPIGEYTHQFTFVPPTLSAGLDFKGYAGPRVSVLLYGVLGPHIDVLACLKLEADTSKIPWWELFGALEVPVGVRMEIFGSTLADANLLAIGVKVKLAQADNIPYGYFSQASYAGDCVNRPPGSCCVRYSDGYTWLLYDGIQGWRTDGFWEGKLIEVAIGCHGDEYFHILSTDLVKHEAP